jgi:uncharacterized repeat protein (TIGR01451 family)
VGITETDDQATVNAGDTVGYSITLTNNGQSTATGVTLSDSLPAGLGKDVNWKIDTTQGDPSAFVLSGAVGSQTLSLVPNTTLAAGASLEVYIDAVTSAADTSASTFLGTLVNTATVNASNEPSAYQNQKATATITIDAPDVGIAETADQSSITAGATAGYTITLTNKGMGTAIGMTLSDSLPAGAGKDVNWTIDTSTGNPNSFVLSGAVGSQTLALASNTTLAAGASLTVHITGATTNSDVGTLTNTATVNAGNEASANQNQSASSSITVSAGSSGEDHDPYITTPYDKIPNFGQYPTIYSVKSGNWSDPTTWSLGRVPTTGDIVSIDGATTVTYDTVSTAAINTVVIQSGGTLTFRTDVSTELTVVNLLVLQGGDLQIGTAANPVAANVTAQVVFANQPLNTTLDPEQYGNGLIGLGTVTMAGAQMNQTFIPLAVEPKAGDTTLTLATAESGWKVGDSVTIPDTHQLNYTERGSNLGNYVSQQETVQIAAISADGTVITLASALKYDHLGARDGNGVLVEMPDVADLSRNVMVRSQSATGVRGYVMFTDRANVDIRDTGFYGLGRTTVNLYDNTTFDASGNVTHVGTNEQDRTPVLFAHLMGPTTIPADGYQYTFIGNAVYCPLEPMTFRWGITLDDSNYGLIQDNVVNNWAGAGIMTEQGNESYNVIDHNFVVDVTGIGGRSADDFYAGGTTTGAYGRDGAGIWLSGPNNYVTNNVATDVYANTYSYGYNLSFYQLGNIRVPAFQGADTSVAGQYTVVNGNAMPLLEFSGNTAYGALQNGLTVWWLGGTDAGPNNVAQSVIKNFTVWNAYQFGYYGYAANNLTLDGFTQYGDFGLLGQGNGTAVGLYFSDYLTSNMTVTNANIQGVETGIGVPTKTNGGAFTVENSYLRDQIDLAVGTMWSVSADPSSLQPRQVVVNNVQFAAAPGFALNAIDMQYSGTSQGGANLIQKDQVLVYNYNGVTGDNFQVFYTQQAANFVIPQSGQYPSGYVLGAPTSGLTNQEAWDQDAIAIAGAVAPSSATNRNGIDGLVNPI